MKPATSVFLLALLIFISACLIGTPESWAFNFTVNSTADEKDAKLGDTLCKTKKGECTLRAAIQEANSFPYQHEITVPIGTYALSLGEFPITEHITINGAGQGSTIIDGNNTYRVFNSLGVNLTLNNLTVQNGTYAEGGGIFNQGDLILQNVTLSANAAGNGYGGGIYNEGSLSLNNCTLTNNQAGEGGGLFNYGTATLINVTLDTNTAISGSGGGIYNTGILSIEKTTISGSSAGAGGGLYNNGLIYLTNVTISGNRANSSGGGIYNGTGGGTPEATLTNVTISGNTAVTNGDGLFNTAGDILSLKNTIVAGIGGGNCSGAITSKGYNLDSGNTCGLNDPTDLRTANPSLGSLQNNGGPTLTHALLSGSPAIGKGDTACPTTDQRGYPRHSACDIGAYEHNDNDNPSDNPLPMITTIAPSNTSPPGGPDLTLTVNGYNFLADSDVLWINSPLVKETWTSTQITATIPASYLSTTGSFPVKVSNPGSGGSGGGLSNEVIFTVYSVYSNNPKPFIAQITPDTGRPGQPVALTVNGSGFLGDSLSVVLWNGIARPTAFVSSSQLTADIPSTDLPSIGTATVTVSNSPPGGGISDPPATFTIGPPLLYLPIILRN